MKVGVVGLGRIATLAHLPSLASLDQVDISAVCDVDEKLLKYIGSKYNVHSQYTDFAGMLEDEIDCVFVLTPANSHPTIVEAFLKSGIDVFCEKPMALTIKDGQSMVKTAEKTGRILMVGFNRRFMPVYKRAKELVKNSKIDICVSKFCVATGHTRLSRPLLDGYIHVVDILRWFCGEPLKVKSCAEYDDPYHEKSIVSLIDFDSGAIGIQISNFNGGGYIEEVEIFGGGKTIKADTVAQITSSIKGGGRNPIVLNEFSTSQWHRLIDKLGYAEQNRHFIECVKRRRKPLASGDDALKTHLLVAEIYSACGLPSMRSCV